MGHRSPPAPVAAPPGCCRGARLARRDRLVRAIALAESSSSSSGQSTQPELNPEHGCTNLYEPFKNSPSIVVCGLVLAAAELLLLPFQNSLPTELLTFLGTGGITILIGIASWRASRRSFPYARMLWLCVTFVALLWSIHFAAGALALK